MSGGEVTPEVKPDRWAQRIAAYALVCGVIALFVWMLREHRLREQQMARGRLVSQLAAAMVFYMTERDDASGPSATILTDLFGKDVVDRHAILRNKADPAAGDILLIERPERVDSEWCFAVFGDGHVKKMRRDEAEAVIREHTRLTAPAASP